MFFLAIAALSAAWLIPAPEPVAAARGAPPRILVLSGQSNHDWRVTTPLIRAALEQGGLAVDVTEHPERLTAESLRPYAAIVSDWNSFHREGPPPVTDWPEAAKRAVSEFVRGGRGFVTLHAGGSSFYEGWPEYQELVIARYGFGQTGHGRVHEFAVRPCSGHPITRGLQDFAIRDELWHRAAVAPGATVLATAFSALESGGSGADEPVVFVRMFGAGRCFNTLLGHGREALENAALRTLLARGVEWAATGEVTIPPAGAWPTTAPASRPATAEAGVAAAPFALEWRRAANRVSLLNHGREVWTLHHGPDVPKPYLHPLALPDGTVLTWDRPADHAWHHGLWFAWKYINGVNYWEERPDTRHSDGRTQVTSAEVETRDDFSAVVRLHIEYRCPERAAEPGAPNLEAPAVLTEERRIEISAPTAAGYTLDWAATFTAQGVVELNRTPLPGEPGGQVWGGYAGLSLRWAEGFRDLHASTPAGAVTEWEDHRHRGRAMALDVSGRIGETAAGAAILEHSGNPRAPTPWYVINEPVMRFMNAALLSQEPLTLVHGQQLTLRYRIVVHAGAWDAAELRVQGERYAGVRE